MSQIVISNEGRGGRRKLPSVFNEQGVAMLSSVLRSKRAVRVNLAIMRAFVRLRHILATHRDLARKIEEHDQKIGMLFKLVEQILTPPTPKKRPIGFITPDEN